MNGSQSKGSPPGRGLFLSKTMFDIKRCSTDADYTAAVGITKDYIDWLNMDLAFQAIDEELLSFSFMYGPPHGVFLLARRGNELAGGVGLRILTPEVCEMKRLFVYDRFKGVGLGRRLCAQIIEEAKKLGYRKMRLDTLGRMIAAKSLYSNFGFKEIEPYRFNPDPKAKYMELDLASHFTESFSDIKSRKKPTSFDRSK